MGFLVAFNRKLTLLNHRNIIEAKIADINAQRLNLTNKISDLASQISDLGDTDSPSVKKLEATKAKLEALDKQLALRLETFQSQLQAINTEYQSADSMLQQNIQQSFSYSGVRQ